MIVKYALGLCILGTCLLNIDAWLFDVNSGDSKCTSAGGNCKTSGCSGSWKTGLCSGAANRRCCVENSGNDGKCTSAGGSCKTSGCSGSWQSGLCSGPVNRKCCVGDDSQCTNAGGKCQTTSCDGSLRTGLCSGQTSRRCCIKSSGNGNKLSHSQAASMLSQAGISTSSSGRCSNRNVRTCTSLEQIRRATITGTINELKKPSRCPVIVTGGTEIGHAGGTYSHWNGYKIDLGLNSCLDKYIKKNFPFHRMRGRYPVYKAPSGNEYCLEGNHWDNTYY
ncbi:unnamed protein product [Owenia fusiformis]|uniref:Uncharacterized protein n=1 Tax=Owenia fusiformis TaxID=6347 RepID=A0A8J1XKX2_OWEFU|nr:unnamed protein product [Owenia fusiformis]